MVDAGFINGEEEIENITDKSIVAKNRSISKNQPCPCGSAKQYKRCCGAEGESVSKKGAHSALNLHVPDAFLKKFPTEEILKACGALALLPENHSKYLRLNLVALKAIKLQNTKGTSIKAPALAKYLETDYPAHHLEDPSINPFTEVVTYFGGDHIVFTGDGEYVTQACSYLLSTVERIPETTEDVKVFKSTVYQFSKFLLVVSDEIAKRCNYSRLITNELQDWQGLIFVPKDEKLQELKDAVQFTKDELLEICVKNKIDPRAIEEAVTRAKDVANVYDPQTAVCYKQPLYKSGNNYIVYCPDGITNSIIEFTLHLSKSLGLHEVLLKTYEGVQKQTSLTYLHHIGYSPIKTDSLTEGEQLALKDEVILSFDTNKLCVCVFHQSPRSSEVGSFIKQIESERHLDERIAKTITTLKSSSEFKNHKVLVLHIAISAGQPFGIAYAKRGDRVLAMHFQDLETYHDSADCDELDFWKFCEARDRNGVHSLSFIDAYATFNNHKQSFYLTDRFTTGMQISPGEGFKYVLESNVRSDMHSELSEEGGKVYNTPVVRRFRHQSIYFSPNDLGKVLKYALSGLVKPVWVTMDEETLKAATVSKGMLFEMHEAVCYWLLEASDFINNLLKQINQPLLQINVQLDDLAKFEQWELVKVKDEELANGFKWKIENERIYFTIPSTFQSAVGTGDNSGERVLVKALLASMVELASKQGIELNVNLDEAVNTIAPLGVKKKVFSFHSSINPLLDVRVKLPLRKVQDYDSQYTLDILLDLIGEDKTPRTISDTKAQRNILVRICEALLGRFRDLVKDIDTDTLIEHFIGLNEAVIYHRATNRMTIPTRLACFARNEKILNDFAEDEEATEISNITIRCIIEHLALEQHSGKKLVSQSLVDELMGIMSIIISLGSLCDVVSYELGDIELSVLPAGRIHFKNDYVDIGFEDYKEAVNEEVVDHHKSRFSGLFPVHDNKEIKKETESSIINASFETAFEEVYSVKFSEMQDLFFAIGFMAYESSKDGFASFTIKGLQEELKNRHKLEITEERLRAFLDNFSLFHTGNLTKPPSKFSRHDIYPWRHNRRLSLLMRPFVKLHTKNESGEDVYLTGPRAIFYAIQFFDTRLTSGKLFAPDGSKLNSALGRIANRMGNSFNEAVYKAVLEFKEGVVEKEVSISKLSGKKADGSMGDIDVLFICPSEKVIISIESKDMSSGKNPHDVAEEINKLFGGTKTKGWMTKHNNRHMWLEQNIPLLQQKFKIDLSGFKVVSLMVTDEIVATKFIKTQKLLFPIIELRKLKQNGLAELLEAKNITKS